MKSVLIIGDWVIDEYWFLVRHQSDISSHVGFNHYRLNDKEGQYVRDLCGAGHIVRLLYQNLEKENQKILGIGIWNKNDNDLIKHLIHCHIDGCNCEIGMSSKSMTLGFCDDEIPVNIWTLNPHGTTIRVIRQYHMENGGLKQISRIDWEPLNKQSEDHSNIEKIQILEENEISDIVVHDLKKGSVTKKLIEDISSKYPNANWYVRSKDDEPDWLSSIDNIKLRLIGPEIASKHNPWKTWLPHNRITAHSIEYLKKINSDHVILLTDNYEMIGKINKGEKCVIAKNKGLTSKIVLGWSSSIFAMLISLLIKKDETEYNFSENDIKDILSAANNEINNFIINSAGSRGITLIESDLNFDQMDILPTISTWQEEKDSWDQAEESEGLIRDGDNLILEVWRGSPCIPGYISCIKEKQNILNRIGENIKVFIKNKNKKRSLSILLQADPGSGKTFLANSIAKAFDLSILRFDVTQMIYRDELLDLFDDIATRQAFVGENLLVVVDEVNSFLDGSHVFSSFLTPLEAGTYMRRGKHFSLKPCVWLFAGTDMDQITDKNEQKSKEENKNSTKRKAYKISDFNSRMTLREKIDYRSLGKSYADNIGRLKDEAKLEQIYLGAQMIRNHFSDVNKISLQVLEAFGNIPPDLEIGTTRFIRKLCSTLQNVQYGIVTKSNCSAWDNISEFDKNSWSGKKDLVRIIYSSK